MWKNLGIAVAISGLILALLGVLVAIAQLRQDKQALVSQDSMLSTQNALLKQQLLVEQQMATLQANASVSGSSPNATLAAERVTELQSTAMALSTQQAKLDTGLLFEDNFDDGNADGWNGKGGDWTVVLDENGNYVYQGNANSGGWAYAIPNSASFEWKNVAIETRWRIITVSNQTDDEIADGQVTFRNQYGKTSGCNYYGVFFDTVNDFVSLARQGFNPDCNWANLIVQEYALELRQWYNLRIETKGPIHKAYINGNLLLEANDDSVAQGAFEIDAAPGGVVQFDDIKVWALSD